MDSMDVKGIAWVGNIYQKFEAMCLEVEEAMCQETAKYVENQVQTMGESMKRFCSDVMQDLLPPSSKDLSKVASAELLLNPYLEFGIHMKPIKEDVKDPVHVKGISEGKKGISEDKSNPSNDAWEDWSAASFNWEISDKDEAKCEESNEDIKRETRGGQEGQICNLIVESPTTTAFTKSSVKGGKRSRYRAENRATCESSELVSQTFSNASSGQSFNEDVSHSGNSADCDPDLEKENNITNTIQTTQPIGDESESGFEETCVLVDENDFHPINPKEETKRSYKKKIQGAFSLKKKSSRKQEYKQLVAQYDKKTDKLTTCDSIDSEWELL